MFKQGHEVLPIGKQKSQYLFKLDKVVFLWGHTVNNNHFLYFCGWIVHKQSDRGPQSKTAARSLSVLLNLMYCPNESQSAFVDTF